MSDETVDGQVAPEIDAAAEETQAEQGQTPSESSPEKKDGVQERINELTRKRREAERQAEYWKAQAERQPPEPEAEPEAVKTLADFEYDEGKYQRYLLDVAKKEAVAEAARILRQGQAQETARSRELEFRSREHEFAAELKDYNKVTRSDDLTITPEMKAAIVEMEKGPQVLYYLGKNPDIAEHIALLSPMRAAIELGKIEAKVSVEPKKTVTDAPAPPPKIEGAAPPTRINPDSPDSDRLSVDEWLRRRNKQVRGK